jgi:hypothetical protein
MLSVHGGSTSSGGWRTATSSGEIYSGELAVLEAGSHLGLGTGLDLGSEAGSLGFLFFIFFIIYWGGHLAGFGVLINSNAEPEANIAVASINLI